MHFALFGIPLLALAASASASPHDQAGKPRAAAGKRHAGVGKRGSGGVKRQPTVEVVPDVYGNSTSSDLSKRQAFTGRGTFYYTGLGACGQYSKDSDYMVALNSAQYGGGYPGPQCFKHITIQANGVTVGGVQIMDECPTCDWGGLDLSPGLFGRFADQGAGVIQLTWWFDGSSPAPSTTTTQAPPTTTWQAPTTTWQAPSTTTTTTTTWQAPSSSSTTTTTQAPTTTSTSTTTTTTMAASSSVTSLSVSASNSTRISASATNTTNPFAVFSSYNGTATASATASISAGAIGTTSTGSSVVDGTSAGNLVMLNGVVTNYGQLIVVGAGGDVPNRS